MTLQFRGQAGAVLWLTGTYAVILAALSVFTWMGPDRWWIGALNLYLPQALWLVPGLFLIVISLRVAPSLVWLPVLCIVWVLGPIMGFCWTVHGTSSHSDSSFRILTWNTKFGRHDMQALMEDVASHKPDIVFFQDATGMAGGPVSTLFQGWHVHAFQQYLIASRLPMAGTEVIRATLPSGRETVFLRSRVQIGEEALSIYNMHFTSPREGLNALRTARKRPWYLPRAIERLEANVQARIAEADTIRFLVRSEKDSVIVAGDLNSTDASLVCAILRDAGLHDCFAEGGTGYGYTYGHFLLQRRIPWATFSWMRIDHIMVSSRLHAVRCWTGTGKASDHRPVIADIYVSAGKSRRQ